MPPSMGTFAPTKEVSFDEVLSVGHSVHCVQGIYASTHIEEGTLIKNDGFVWIVTDPVKGDESNVQYAEKKRQSYMRQWAGVQREFAATHPDLEQWFSELEPKKEKGQLKVEWIENVIRTNGWAHKVQKNGVTINNTMVSIYKGSKYNHSCAPNLEAHLRLAESSDCGRSPDTNATQDPKELWTTTLRAIEAGEEVTVSYLSTRALGQDVLRRRDKLLRMWGFVCNCSQCKLDMLTVNMKLTLGSPAASKRAKERKQEEEAQISEQNEARRQNEARSNRLQKNSWQRGGYVDKDPAAPSETAATTTHHSFDNSALRWLSEEAEKQERADEAQSDPMQLQSLLAHVTSKPSAKQQRETSEQTSDANETSLTSVPADAGDVSCEQAVQSLSSLKEGSSTLLEFGPSDMSTSALSSTVTKSPPPPPPPLKGPAHKGPPCGGEAAPAPALSIATPAVPSSAETPRQKSKRERQELNDTLMEKHGTRKDPIAAIEIGRDSGGSRFTDANGVPIIWKGKLWRDLSTEEAIYRWKLRDFMKYCHSDSMRTKYTQERTPLTLVAILCRLVQHIDQYLVLKGSVKSNKILEVEVEKFASNFFKIFLGVMNQTHAKEAGASLSTALPGRDTVAQIRQLLFSDVFTTQAVRDFALFATNEIPELHFTGSMRIVHDLEWWHVNLQEQLNRYSSNDFPDTEKASKNTNNFSLLYMLLSSTLNPLVHQAASIAFAAQAGPGQVTQSTALDS